MLNSSELIELKKFAKLVIITRVISYGRFARKEATLSGSEQVNDFGVLPPFPLGGVARRLRVR